MANRLLLTLSFAACLSLSCSGEKVGGNVNIAEFAKMECDDQGIVLHWEEPRDIYKVVVKTDPVEAGRAKASILAKPLA